MSRAQWGGLTTSKAVRVVLSVRSGSTNRSSIPLPVTCVPWVSSAKRTTITTQPRPLSASRASLDGTASHAVLPLVLCVLLPHTSPGWERQVAWRAREGSRCDHSPLICRTIRTTIRQRRNVQRAPPAVSPRHQELLAAANVRAESSSLTQGNCHA